MDPLAYPERRGMLGPPWMGLVSSGELFPVQGGM